MVGKTRRWRKVQGEKGGLECRVRRRVDPFDLGRGLRGGWEVGRVEQHSCGRKNGRWKVRGNEELKSLLSDIRLSHGSNIGRARE